MACCYVCCEEAEVGEVCRCAVHRECAERWVEVSGRRVCAVCGETFAVAAPPAAAAAAAEGVPLWRVVGCLVAVALTWMAVGSAVFRCCPWLVVVVPAYCCCSAALTGCVYVSGARARLERIEPPWRADELTLP